MRNVGVHLQHVRPATRASPGRAQRRANVAAVTYELSRGTKRGIGASERTRSRQETSMLSLKGLIIAASAAMAFASVSCAGTDYSTADAGARHTPAYNVAPIWSSNQGRVP